MSLALWNRVTSRFSTQLLRGYTNPDDPTATAIDATKGTTAADDARVWFKRTVGVAYDDGDSDHHDVAVLATYVLLREYAGKTTDAVTRDRERAQDQMQALAYRTHNKRVTSRTTHRNIIPTDEDTEGVTDRPLFDDGRFDKITPDKPRT